jgi:3-oxoacyl-[acyl-carrier protein] reductase
MNEYRELSRSIAGKVAIITGAASGIGRATAYLFAKEGAAIVAVDVNQDRLTSLLDELKAQGHEQVLALKVDVTSKPDIDSCIARTVDQFGGIDIVVNNAGMVIPVSLESDQYDEVWDKSVGIMLTAHQTMVRAALPYLKKSDSARIVNLASVEAFGAQPMSGPYAAAKHGVLGLTRSMAVELGPLGINTNAICPGPVHTQITAPIKDEHKEIYAKRRVPLRRYGIPEEIAHMTLSCVLPAASYLNGAAIVVDGGMLVKNG